VFQTRIRIVITGECDASQQTAGDQSAATCGFGLLSERIDTSLPYKQRGRSSKIFAAGDTSYLEVVLHDNRVIVICRPLLRLGEICHRRIWA
jgi:hypothetical protein